MFVNDSEIFFSEIIFNWSSMDIVNFELLSLTNIVQWRVKVYGLRAFIRPLCAVYSKQLSTYRILSLVPTCVTIWSTIYCGLPLLFLVSSTSVFLNSRCAKHGWDLGPLSYCWRIWRLRIVSKWFGCWARVAHSVETTLSIQRLRMTSEWGQICTSRKSSKLRGRNLLQARRAVCVSSVSEVTAKGGRSMST